MVWTGLRRRSGPMLLTQTRTARDGHKPMPCHAVKGRRPRPTPVSYTHLDVYKRQVDKWEAAHFAEDDIRSKVKAAKKKYEDALREKFFGF